MLPAQSLTFDNFVPGHNFEALSALMQMHAGQAIYIFGEIGCGKTHLLHATCMAKQGSFFNASNLSTLNLTELNYPLIAIDDLQLLSLAQQEVVFDLFNIWKTRQHGKDAFMLALSGPQAPLQMKIREDLRNRLGWDLAFRIHSLSDDDILLALQQYTLEKGMKINQESYRWLMNHCERNIRILFAWLDALDLHSIAQRRQITVPFIKEFMQQFPLTMLELN